MKSESPAAHQLTRANVWLPVTAEKTIPWSVCAAAMPAAGLPSDQTTRPSSAIVVDDPDAGIETLPVVPAGAEMVSWKLDPSRVFQRETIGPWGVGTWPWAQLRSPGCGALVQVW